MDEDLIVSDLCEESGFPRQAALLRAMAGGTERAYVVAERGFEYNDENNYVSDRDGTPQTLYLDRDEAEQAVSLLNGRRLREIDLSGFGLDTEDFTTLPLKELESRVGALLGITFELFPDGMVNPTQFPESATDEQMTEVARLFDRLPFYHVIEVEFAG
ncbi:MAG TPA: hypothetical protein VFT74_16020 [Isosphaeraceae bacterium]|nr:hypothetical protein [Isosphaeraceae bacterium]